MPSTFMRDSENEKIVKNYILFLLILIYSTSLLAQTAVQDSSKHENASELTDSIWGLKEIQVTAQRNKKIITGTMNGKLVLQADALASLPHMLGTTDMLRTLQLMPGVQTSGEINSGIYVRGGEPSHNQLLLNGAPIYNAMHLLGFFSVFNSGHFSKLTLLKSNVGSEYGGRLGAVLSMETKDSIVTKPTIEGDIGLISSQGTLALPISSKSSLYVSGRGTYIDPIINAIQSSEDGTNLNYGFQDYNLTYVWKPSSQSKIIINGYYGGDKLSIKESLYQVDGGIKWHNIASSIRWLLTFNDKSRLEQTAFFSSYKNEIRMNQNASSMLFPSEIKDVGYKGYYYFQALGGEWQTGLDYACHLTDPQYPVIKEMFGTNATTPLQRYKTHETGIFFQYRTFLTKQLGATLGLRYSSLFHTGSYQDKKFNSLGREEQATNYQQGELVKYYGGFEPHFSIDYQLNANQKIILSYRLRRQYMNQVSVSGIGFPTDFWVPASKNILPQSAHTLSAGYYTSILGDAYEISLEGYYTQLRNQLEFDGEMLDMVNQRYNIEDRLLSGEGKTYGVELLLKKNRGRVTGWIGYTLGWSRRNFPDINNGHSFPAKHDRRHDLSLAAIYRINNKWDCSAVFVYATGNAFTMPTALYMVGENAINEYGPHNGARMPAYHRMDISVNYWFTKSKTKESGLNFSLYNAYARKNPIFLNVGVYINEDQKTVKIKKKGKHLYSLLPSISYRFKF